jgi:L-ascorbate metabolism protein UlaG (beta-lactamase superfamily)
MKITWFGHSAFRVETGSAAIMIDPFLSGNPSFGGDAAAAAKGATHVILTHGHDDHTGDTVDICQATGALLTANFEVCMFLNGKGVENINPCNHGGNLDLGDFTVAYVPAWHSSSTIVDGKPVYLGNPAGIVVQPKKEPRKILYHMGDTDIFSGMELIDEIYRPVIGIVPIGDRFTMGARLAAMACKRYFKFKTVVPCHYGTFPIIDRTADKFIAEMEGQNVVVPKIGEPFDV